ncbi:MAG: PSD1 domain-containing protein [Planctomycetes bacterium]|nr:PSD1 domain-containing protein [Planctomycetota bacterium]
MPIGLPLVVVLALGEPRLAAAGDAPDFERVVAPLLETRCLACHSDAAAKGGLSLESFEGARRGGKSGEAALVAGDPDGSALIEAITPRVAADGARKARMPKGGAPLADGEIAALRDWIAAGAAWPEGRRLVDRSAEAAFAARCDWWSLRPLAPSEPPNDEALAPSTPLPPLTREQLARGIEPPRNAIDRFVRAELAKQGLEPAPVADRRTLIRRATWDLTGLPPTPEEVAAFEYESTQGGVLAGGTAELRAAGDRAWERLIDRLLAAPEYGERFARHWLDVAHFGETHGFDKDKPRPHAWPYRDWVIESLNRDLPWGDFVARQLAADVVAPDEPAAVRALGFLAAGPWDYVGHVELREGTVDKAITRLLDRDDVVANVMSSFASATVHCARCHDHKFDAIGQQDYYALQAVFAGVERADREFDRDPAVAARRAQLLAELAALEAAGAGGEGGDARRLAALGWHGEIVAADETTQWVAVDLGAAHALEEIALFPAHESYGGWPGPGFGFPLRFVVEASPSGDFADARVLHDARGADVANPGDAPLVIDARGAPIRAVRVTATKLWKRTGDFAFALGEVACFAGARNVAVGGAVTASSSIEMAPRWGAANLVDGSSWLGAVDGTAWRERVAARARLDAALAQLPPRAKVYAATARFTPEGAFTPSERPRPIHVLSRGDVNAPLAVAEPGALRCVAELPARFALPPEADESARRAALAAWLVDPRHPLTWRSIVNRVWQWHFGRGLVDTPNDFGHMGGLPSHPELLDWLAREFLAGGGSLKRLHRLILNSATWRQQAQGAPAALAADGDNRLLARMHRTRLDAEPLRDGLLAMAGRLERRGPDGARGGPSARHFVFTDDHSPIYDYAKFAASDGINDPAARRRAIYRFTVRSVPDPWMESLDCPDASLLTPKRNVTITALQALALLNDPFVIEQCRQLAARLERERPLDAAAQIERLFELALARPPTASERAALLDHASAHGLAAACRVVVNLDEFLFVD